MTTGLTAESDKRLSGMRETWVYGWTHFGQIGQTQARMNTLTRDVEVHEYKKWIKCRSDCDKFFTPAGI